MSLKNTTNGTVVVNPPNGFPQKVCCRKNGQLTEEVLFCYWKCVCNDHFLKTTTRQPLYRWWTAKQTPIDKISKIGDTPMHTEYIGDGPNLHDQEYVSKIDRSCN